MKTNYDYIVIGVGGIGSAAAYWLARNSGGSVLGLEQFEINHSRGDPTTTPASFGALITCRNTQCLPMRRIESGMTRREKLANS